MISTGRSLRFFVLTLPARGAIGLAILSVYFAAGSSRGSIQHDEGLAGNDRNRDLSARSALICRYIRTRMGDRAASL